MTAITTLWQTNDGFRPIGGFFRNKWNLSLYSLRSQIYRYWNESECQPRFEGPSRAPARALTDWSLQPTPPRARDLLNTVQIYFVDWDPAECAEDFWTSFKYMLGFDNYNDPTEAAPAAERLWICSVQRREIIMPALPRGWCEPPARGPLGFS